MPHAGKAGYGISSELLTVTKGQLGAIGDERIQWQVMYCDVKFFNAKTEVDARAKMLLYLLENKLSNTMFSAAGA